MKWIAQEFHDYIEDIVIENESGTKSICKVHNHANTADEPDEAERECQANARLIAAAPDLLDACKRDALLAAVAISKTPTGDQRNKLTEINILRLAAIAKAEP